MGSQPMKKREKMHRSIIMIISVIIYQERERLKEEKRLEAVRLKEWSKPREDLELDDLMVCFIRW